MSSSPNQNDKKEPSELETTMALAPVVVAVREVLSDFRFKRLISAVNWILAGTIAFIYSILSDPDKFVGSYGQWQSKTALVLFAISFFYRIRNVIGANALSVITESETLKKIIEFSHVYEKSVKKEQEKKEGNPKQPIEQVAVEGMVNALISHLKGTRSFWLQLFTFIAGAGILNEPNNYFSISFIFLSIVCGFILHHQSTLPALAK